MCIGVPAQVISVNGFIARCQSRYGLQDVNTMLIGKVEINDWLFVFLENAREKITAEHAQSLNSALDAVEKINNNQDNWQSAFADILARESGEVSRLPPHLKHLENIKNKK